jgi:hypothetical protein
VKTSRKIDFFYQKTLILAFLIYTMVIELQAATSDASFALAGDGSFIVFSF